jgi:RNA polymerase sigma-70 factor (ECF subfamily)
MLAFERESRAVARSAIARVNRDPEFVQETLRRLWDKLLFGQDAKVSEYSGRGPLNAWVRVAAARTALDCCRAQQLSWSRQADLSEAIADEGCGPESNLAKMRYAGAFQQALEHALAALSSRDRNLLRMHVVDRCSIDQLGRAYGVHRATAARWLERAKTGIFAAVRQELGLQHTALTDSEFRSLAQLMGSELELTLSARPAEIGCAQSPEAG